MKESEEITQEKVLEPISDLMEQYIKGCMLMIRLMEKELVSMLMENSRGIFMKEYGKMISDMVEEYITLIMETGLKVTLKTTIIMVREYFTIIIETGLKETIKMARYVVEEFSIKQMERK